MKISVSFVSGIMRPSRQGGVPHVKLQECVFLVEKKYAGVFFKERVDEKVQWLEQCSVTGT